MGWTPTLIITGLALVTTLVCGWRGARPPDLMRGPRLMPWRFLMLLGGAALALMIVHMATLAKGG